MQEKAFQSRKEGDQGEVLVMAPEGDPKMRNDGRAKCSGCTVFQCAELVVVDCLVSVRAQSEEMELSNWEPNATDS